MHNFYHEIPMPSDKAIQKFLWVSYFHDALIQQILPGQPKPYDLTLQIYSGHDGYTYLLRFHYAVHFEYNAPMPWHTGQEISSTVFKDSALLHRLQAEEDKPLYHLRFSHWNGYTDVIFERFSIRREGGRVNYKSEVPAEMITWDRQYHAPNFRFYLKHDPFQVDIATLNGDDQEDLDEQIDDILWAQLYHHHTSARTDELLQLSRSILAEQQACKHARTYAAFLLGKHGTSEDMPTLTEQFLSEQNLLKKRVIMDAMELIQERTNA